MILVLLGTQNNSFTRLLDEVQKCIDDKIINEEVIVQAGYTKYTSRNMKIIDFISSEELIKLTKQATFIITHGGVGSIVESLKLNKKIIAVPRLKKYGEHVNDHQVQIIENFTSKGYIIGVTDAKKLSEALKNIDKFFPKKYTNTTSNIIQIISDYIDNT